MDPRVTSGQRRLALVQIVVAMCGWGTIGVFVLQAHAAPITIVFLRCAFGAVTLAAVGIPFRYLTTRGLTRRTLPVIVGSGLSFVGSWVFLFAAFQLTSLTVATVVYHMQPFFVLLIGAVVLRERIGRAKVLWILAAFGGLVLATNVIPKLMDGRLDGRYLLGVGCALVTAVLYGTGVMTARSVRGVHPSMVSLLQCLVGVVVLLPLAHLASVHWGSGGWLWILVMGVVHTGLLYTLLYSALPRLSTPTVAVLAFLNPLVAICCDYVVYGHRPGPLQLVGVLAIVLASVAVARDRGDRRRAGPPEEEPAGNLVDAGRPTDRPR